MREEIMHAQPSSGSMHLIFGPYVRPNGACLSRLLHIVDNFSTEANSKCLIESDLECSLFSTYFCPQTLFSL